MYDDGIAIEISIYIVKLRYMKMLCIETISI